MLCHPCDLMTCREAKQGWTPQTGILWCGKLWNLGEAARSILWRVCLGWRDKTRIGRLTPEHWPEYSMRTMHIQGVEATREPTQWQSKLTQWQHYLIWDYSDIQIGKLLKSSQVNSNLSAIVIRIIILEIVTIRILEVVSKLLWFECYYISHIW